MTHVRDSAADAFLALALKEEKEGTVWLHPPPVDHHRADSRGGRGPLCFAAGAALGLGLALAAVAAAGRHLARAAQESMY